MTMRNIKKEMSKNDFQERQQKNNGNNALDKTEANRVCREKTGGRGSKTRTTMGLLETVPDDPVKISNDLWKKEVILKPFLLKPLRSQQ